MAIANKLALTDDILTGKLQFRGMPGMTARSCWCQSSTIWRRRGEQESSPSRYQQVFWYQWSGKRRQHSCQSHQRSRGEPGQVLAWHKDCQKNTMIVQGFIVMRKMKEKYLGLVVQRGGVTSGTRGHRLNPPSRKLEILLETSRYCNWDAWRPLLSWSRLSF